MITDNLSSIQKTLNGYDPTLIAVSKKQPDYKIEAALKAGISIFGENRVQEAMERWGSRKAQYPDLELHLIGPLQTNKVKQAVSLFDTIHTLDREKLAREIVKHSPDMTCFIQVNVGDEPQKAGIARQDLSDFYNFCNNLNMNIIGLMCIPPQGDDPAPHFEWMQTQAKNLNLPYLSMGMSSDYRTALEHGATHIRIGTAVFGPRQ